MSILHKTARQSSSLAFLWRISSARVRTFSIGAYSNFQKDTLKTAPGWDDDNATESEADVKADREPLPKNVEELQKESIENLKRSKVGDTHRSNFVNRGSHAKGMAQDVDDHVDADRGA